MKNIVLAITISIFVACVAAFSLLWSKGNAVPYVYIPDPPPVPAHNAFDTFGRAYLQFHDLDRISNSLNGRVIVSPDFSNALKNITPASANHIATENEPAIATLEIGLREPYWATPWRTVNQTFPYLKCDRAMARGLSLNARVAGQKGDWPTVARESLDCIELGMKVEEDGAIIPRLVGLACGAIGRSTAWAAVDHLNSADANSSAHRLEALTNNRASFATALQEEKEANDACLVSMFQYTASRDSFRSDANLPDKVDQSIYFTFHPKSTSLGLYDSYMNADIHTASLPFQAASKMGDPALPNDVYCALVCPVTQKALLKDTCDVAFDRLLSTSFALRAYYLDHGNTYPPSLDALTPKYLSHIPIDPFGSGTSPLIYRRTQSGYLLYSVGPDGKDDGGRAFLHHSIDGSVTRRWCTADDTGDIVAGINCG